MRFSRSSRRRRRRLSLALSLGALLAGAPAAPLVAARAAQTPPASPSDLEKLMDAGVDAYAKEDFAGAIKIWQGALETARTRGEKRWQAKLLNKIGQTYDEGGDIDKAREALQQ